MSKELNNKVTTEINDDFFQFAGIGSAPTDNNDLSMPWVKLCQTTTSEVAENKAKAGDFFNTLTGQNYGARVFFVPCGYKKELVHWHSFTSKEGKGLIDKHPYTTDNEKINILDKHYPELIKDGATIYTVANRQKILVDTAYWFGLFVDKDRNYENGVIAFKSSGLAASKSIWKVITTAKKKKVGNDFLSPPCFANSVVITSEMIQGTAFYAPKAEKYGTIMDVCDASAKDCKKQYDLFGGSSLQISADQIDKPVDIGTEF